MQRFDLQKLRRMKSLTLLTLLLELTFFNMEDDSCVGGGGGEQLQN